MEYILKGVTSKHVMAMHFRFGPLAGSSGLEFFPGSLGGKQGLERGLGTSLLRERSSIAGWPCALRKSPAVEPPPQNCPSFSGLAEVTIAKTEVALECD